MNWSLGNTKHDLGKVHLLVAFTAALTKYQTEATQGRKDLLEFTVQGVCSLQ